MNGELAYVYGVQGVALNGALVVVADELDDWSYGVGRERVGDAVVEEPDVFLLFVASVEPVCSMKERAEVQKMKELDFAKKLDQREEYLALLECLPRLEHHQVVAYLVHSVRLWEVSVAQTSMAIADLAMESRGHRIRSPQRVSSAPLAHFQTLYF